MKKSVKNLTWHLTNHGRVGQKGFKLSFLGFGVGALTLAFYSKQKIHAEDILKEKTEVLKTAGKKLQGLPEFQKAEVERRKSNSNEIWVTYKQGVYDITDFVAKHPGGKSILMAAGKSLEPFWNLYAVHKDNTEVYAILEEYRIGNLVENNPVTATETLEPIKSIPNILASKYELEVLTEWQDLNNKVKIKCYSFDDLKNKFPKVEIESSTKCGNSKNEKKVGLKWAGVRLSELIKDYDLQGIKHVKFVGYDQSPHEAFITLEKALSGDVILAYEMNGDPLTQDRGFPIRVVAIGIGGGRNVKWLRRIILSP